MCSAAGCRGVERTANCAVTAESKGKKVAKNHKNRKRKQNEKSEVLFRTGDATGYIIPGYPRRLLLVSPIEAYEYALSSHFV